jgi:hypothetical protein
VGGLFAWTGFKSCGWLWNGLEWFWNGLGIVLGRFWNALDGPNPLGTIHGHLPSTFFPKVLELHSGGLRWARGGESQAHGPEYMGQA